MDDLDWCGGMYPHLRVSKFHVRTTVTVRFQKWHTWLVTVFIHRHEFHWTGACLCLKLWNIGVSPSRAGWSLLRNWKKPALAWMSQCHGSGHPKSYPAKNCGFFISSLDNWTSTNYTTPQLHYNYNCNYTTQTTLHYNYNLQLQLHYTTTTATTALHHTTSSSCGEVTTATIATTPKTQLQPPFGPSVDSLCHPWVTTTNLSYRFPVFETSAIALCGTTGIIIYF